jgi:hypothetical protein
MTTDTLIQQPRTANVVRASSLDPEGSGTIRSAAGSCGATAARLRWASNSHRYLASDEETAGSIWPPRRGFTPANLFSRRLPNLVVVSDFGSRMGATMSAQVRLDAVTVAAGRFLASPNIGFQSTVTGRPVCVVVIDAAVRTVSRSASDLADRCHFVVTRRYSSGLLNFAAQSPEDSQRNRNCRSARLKLPVPKGLFQYITAATRACRCAHRGVIWRASWRRSPESRWLAGMRRVARGVGADSRATAAHRLGGGHVHANDGRRGPGWGRCPAWWTGCIGRCYRGCCTFRLARFRLSVTSVFAGLHSAWRG